jgi:hypothetical protein
MTANSSTISESANENGAVLGNRDTIGGSSGIQRSEALSERSSSASKGAAKESKLSSPGIKSTERELELKQMGASDSTLFHKAAPSPSGRIARAQEGLQNNIVNQLVQEGGHFARQRKILEEFENRHSLWKTIKDTYKGSFLETVGAATANYLGGAVFYLWKNKFAIVKDIAKGLYEDFGIKALVKGITTLNFKDLAEGATRLVAQFAGIAGKAIS